MLTLLTDRDCVQGKKILCIFAGPQQKLVSHPVLVTVLHTEVKIQLPTPEGKIRAWQHHKINTQGSTQGSQAPENNRKAKNLSNIVG